MVSIVRAKRLTKAKFDPLKVQQVEGLDIQLEPVEGQKDTYKLLVKATDPNMTNYNLTIDATGRWKSKIRSTMFSVEVPDTRLSKN